MDSKLTFDATRHLYTDEEGNAYRSVTQLLHAMGLAPDYSAVPPEVLQAAADRGNRIHAQVEADLQAGNDTPETAPLKGWSLIDAERMAANADYRLAGRYDLRMRDPDGRETVVDVKCTSEPPHEYCAWQLSLYRWLLGLPQSSPVYMLHLPKQGEPRLYREPNHSDAEILRLLDAWRDGRPFTSDAQAKVAAILNGQAVAVLDRLALAEAEAKALKAQADKLKAAILSAMQEGGVKTMTCNGWRLTATREGVRKGIDAARLWAEMPTVAARYETHTNTSATLRITRNKEDITHA